MEIRIIYIIRQMIHGKNMTEQLKFTDLKEQEKTHRKNLILSAAEKVFAKKSLLQFTPISRTKNLYMWKYPLKDSKKPLK